jgi:hypothetical protein
LVILSEYRCIRSPPLIVKRPLLFILLLLQHHLGFEFLDLSLALLSLSHVFCSLSLLGTLDVDFHVLGDLVREFEFQLILQLQCLDLFLEIVQEVETLRELDVPHEGMGETEAYLLEVQVA